MPRHLALFLTAVQFLTRVPVPALKAFQPDWTARSARYFPLVGALVGMASGLVLIGASHVWSGVLPALLATVVGIAITGAFHEDGLADTADGLGGGQTTERRLEIMKDSQLGTFGVLALGLALALKVTALSQTPVWPAVLALVAAHGGGRGAAVLAMRLLPYAGDRAATKVKPTADGVTPGEVVTAIAFAALAMVPIALTAPLATGAAVLVGAIAAFVMARLARRLIGGWVGDTLGATEQMFEIGFLVVFAGMVAR
ncbi:adenosylcobinamide-GDP ribazoletransferase [soil metagenome]